MADRASGRVAEYEERDDYDYGDPENLRRTDLQRSKVLDRQGPPGRPATIPGAGQGSNPPDNPQPNPRPGGSQRRVAGTSHSPSGARDAFYDTPRLRSQLAQSSQSPPPNRAFPDRRESRELHHTFAPRARLPKEASASSRGSAGYAPEYGNQYGPPVPLSQEAQRAPSDPIATQARYAEAGRSATQQPRPAAQRRRATLQGTSQAPPPVGSTSSSHSSQDSRATVDPLSTDSPVSPAQHRAVVHHLMRSGWSAEAAVDYVQRNIRASSQATAASSSRTTQFTSGRSEASLPPRVSSVDSELQQTQARAAVQRLTQLGYSPERAVGLVRARFTRNADSQETSSGSDDED